MTFRIKFHLIFHRKKTKCIIVANIHKVTGIIPQDYSITHKKHKITAIKIQVMVIGLVSYDSELADDDKIVIISGNDFIFIDV
ncbi:MAG: hypothetical protein QQN41_11715 [Nitrosopumilus sp.]